MWGKEWGAIEWTVYDTLPEGYSLLDFESTKPHNFQNPGAKVKAYIRSDSADIAGLLYVHNEIYFDRQETDEATESNRKNIEANRFVAVKSDPKQSSETGERTYHPFYVPGGISSHDPFRDGIDPNKPYIERVYFLPDVDTSTQPFDAFPDRILATQRFVKDGFDSHANRTDNPHSVTAEQLGAVTSSTFLTELGNQAGLSIDSNGYLITDNSYRIKPQYLPVTQNRAMAEGMGATIYDLTSYELQETGDGAAVTLVDANGAEVASFDKETGCIQAGDGSIHFNGSWPGSTAEVIEKDHLIRGNEIQGDKVGYPIYTVGDDGILKDRCINIVDTTGKTSWTAVFPESATAADFAIVYTCGCAPTFPDGLGFRTDASLEAFSEWSFVEGSTYLITFTQLGSAVYYASMRELQ